MVILVKVHLWILSTNVDTAIIENKWILHRADNLNILKCSLLSCNISVCIPREVASCYETRTTCCKWNLASTESSRAVGFESPIVHSSIRIIVVDISGAGHYDTMSRTRSRCCQGTCSESPSSNFTCCSRNSGAIESYFNTIASISYRDTSIIRAATHNQSAIDDNLVCLNSTGIDTIGINGCCVLFSGSKVKHRSVGQIPHDRSICCSLRAVQVIEVSGWEISSTANHLVNVFSPITSSCVGGKPAACSSCADRVCCKLHIVAHWNLCNEATNKNFSVTASCCKVKTSVSRRSRTRCLNLYDISTSIWCGGIGDTWMLN